MTSNIKYYSYITWLSSIRIKQVSSMITAMKNNYTINSIKMPIELIINLKLVIVFNFNYT